MFGVSRRESHDASAFYSRFTPPILSDDCEVNPDKALDKLIVGDARHMDEVPDRSVALVVTSPPYFAGKEYEIEIERGVPVSYVDYLTLLREVFAECVRTLEPGGRLAINVANLGRRPYRSLSADVISILQDDLGLLLRGEIVWLKQRGSSGSCAWGSFQKATNPVLRDTTERVIVASKGRFDRALNPRRRAELDLPFESSMTREDFLEDTIDVWEIPAESATRVGHPAPFPVELAARLIELYTYRGDLVLDPFVGSGSAAVAAVQRGRHYVGYDLDQSYIRAAEARLEDHRQRQLTADSRLPLELDHPDAEWADVKGLARSAKELAQALVTAAGFSVTKLEAKRGGGMTVTLAAVDPAGRTWLFDVAGALTSHRPGLRRTDALWRAVAKAAVLREADGAPYVVLTPELPEPRAGAGRALAAVTGPGRPVHAVIDMGNPAALAQLSDLVESQPSDT